MSIVNKDGLAAVSLQLDYAYTAHNLPATINESAGGTSTGIVTFTYDNRGRLIHEVRTGTSAYNLAYEYDQGGNRTKKIDALASREWVYHYDVGDYATYGSDNNRLEFYQEFDTSGGGSVLAATTWYFYNVSGNVIQVVSNQAGTSAYTAHRLDYFSNGQAVEYLLGESWSWDGNPNNDPTGYAVSYARAFRYDGARQRYMNSVIDPLTMQTTSTTWSDYDGNTVYGDFTTTGGNSPTITETRSFELGLATTGDPLGTPTTEYYHPNLIGTTRQMSDGTGTTIAPAVYTAFGEKISGTTHRYGYVGAWGYQTEDTAPPASPFIHVGARYYDPATGRFLQRDPIGIRGGINVYEYARDNPVAAVDPSGLSPGLDIPTLGTDIPSLRVLWPLVLATPLPTLSVWAGACSAAAYVGWKAGTELDAVVKRATGKSISDRTGDWMYRTCPSCFDWTVDRTINQDDELRRFLLEREGPVEDVVDRFRHQHVLTKADELPDATRAPTSRTSG